MKSRYPEVCPVPGQRCPAHERHEAALCGYLRILHMQGAPRCHPARVSPRSAHAERFDVAICHTLPDAVGAHASGTIREERSDEAISDSLSPAAMGKGNHCRL